jgi:hypothetical protein
MPGNKALAPSKSCACLGVGWTPVELPSASTVARIFVLSPPRPRSIASASRLLFSRLRYIDAHARWSSRSWHIHCRHRPPATERYVARRRFCSNGCAEHVSRENHPTAPINRAREYTPDRGTELLRQTAIIVGCPSDMPFSPRQPILDLLPLVISQSITSRHHCLALLAAINVLNVPMTRHAFKRPIYDRP